MHIRVNNSIFLLNVFKMAEERNLDLLTESSAEGRPSVCRLNLSVINASVRDSKVLWLDMLQSRGFKLQQIQKMQLR